MNRQVLITGLMLLGTRSVWAAGKSGLSAHEPLMWKAMYGLIPLAVVLILWEVIERKRGSGGSSQGMLEIDRLAQYAAQKQARNPSRGASVEIAPPMAPAPAPPPPPPAAPSRSSVPPPPPPPPPPSAVSAPSMSAPATGQANPFARLSQIGQQESAPPTGTPGIAPGLKSGFPSADPPAAAPAAPLPTPGGSLPAPGGGGGGGGWAELLQRVRAGEDSPSGPPVAPAAPQGSVFSPPPPPPPPAPHSPASDASSGSGTQDAWEALLKKTTGGGGESPSAKIPPAGNPLSNALGSNPFAPTGGESSSLGDEALPDYVKKASRTISLDLKKGGGPPPPLPKTEG